MKHTGQLTIILVVAALALLPSCGAPPQATQPTQSTQPLPTTQPTGIAQAAIPTLVPPTRQPTGSSPTAITNSAPSTLTGRGYPAMGYDSQMDRVILFGGAEK